MRVLSTGFVVLAISTRCTSEPGSSFDAGADVHDAIAEIHYVGGDEHLEAPTPSFAVPSSVSVVQGETTYLPIQNSGVTITGITNLPSGVTAGAITWQGLPLTADASAPIAKSTATVTSDLAPSQDVTVYVTARDGSLDPTFGAGGVAGTAGIIHAISVMSDGRIVVVEEYYSSLFVQRLTPDGKVDTTYGQSGSANLGSCYARAAAVAPDGEIAVACLPMGGVHVYVLAADGTLARTVDAVGDASAAAWYTTMWSGSNVVVMDFLHSDTVLPSNQIVTANIPQAAPYWGAYPTATSRVVMGGELNQLPTLTAVVPTQGVYSLDTTFGDGGTVPLAATFTQGTSVATTSTGAWIVEGSTPPLTQQTLSDVIRVASDGTPDATWGAQGHVFIKQMPGPLVSLPTSNRVIVTGESNGTLLERLLTDGSIDSSFGYLGTVYTSATNIPTSLPTAACVDASETVLYVGGNGWLLRYRIHA